MDVTRTSDRHLDILCVGTLPPHPGGSAISCSELITGLAGLGHAVRVVAPITAEGLASQDRFAVHHPEIKVTRYLVPWFDIAPPVLFPQEYRELERRQLKEKISRLIAGRRPDVLLIARESFAWSVPALAKDYLIPSVMLIRGGSRTAKLLNGEYPDDLKLRLLKEYRKVTQLVAVANQLTDGLRRLGFNNVKTISNAVDTRRFGPRPRNFSLLEELRVQDGDVVVMHVANLQERKRSMDLVRSAELALRSDRRLLYVIVGDGPLRQAMVNACREKRIAERVRFVGWIDYDQMPEYINIADVVVVPSESEGLARVYLETQAAARLLLASDIPPAREVIVDGETGLLFEKGNIVDLTAKTLFAAREPQLRARIGRRARKQIKNRSIEDVVEAYIAILRGVVSDAPAAL